MIAVPAHRLPLVLVVEDDDLLRLTSSLELAANGFRTVEARSADEAVALLEQYSIDAIFTDVCMPGSMNGFALAHHVSQKQPDTYVLITSGDGLPAEQQIPSHSDFVPKPYALPSIAAIIRSHMRKPLPS